jgi:hypothetical protein
MLAVQADPPADAGAARVAGRVRRPDKSSGRTAAAARRLRARRTAQAGPAGGLGWPQSTCARSRHSARPSRTCGPRDRTGRQPTLPAALLAQRLALAARAAALLERRAAVGGAGLGANTVTKTQNRIRALARSRPPWMQP